MATTCCGYHVINESIYPLVYMQSISCLELTIWIIITKKQYILSLFRFNHLIFIFVKEQLIILIKVLIRVPEDSHIFSIIVSRL